VEASARFSRESERLGPGFRRGVLWFGVAKLQKQANGPINTLGKPVRAGGVSVGLAV